MCFVSAWGVSKPVAIFPEPSRAPHCASEIFRPSSLQWISVAEVHRHRHGGDWHTYIYTYIFTHVQYVNTVYQCGMFSGCLSHSKSAKCCSNVFWFLVSTFSINSMHVLLPLLESSIICQRWFSWDHIAPDSGRKNKNQNYIAKQII